MEVVAYAIKITERDELIIQAMASVLTTNRASIFDLDSYEPEDQPGKIVFIFGEGRKIKKAQKVQGDVVMLFPKLECLYTETGDEGERAMAYQKLLRVRDGLAASVSESKIIPQGELEPFTIDSVPNISSEEILALLKKANESKEIGSWMTVDKQGRKIEFSLESIESSEHLTMTFAELLLLKIAMELLDVQEIDFVKRR